MINLTPIKEKKVMINSFYYRLSALFLISLALVMLIAGIALLPAYLISKVKANAASGKLNSEKVAEEYIVDADTLVEISALDHKLSLLEKSKKEEFLVSERVINEILSNKISGIKITEITFESFESSGTQGKKVGIRGTAPSRERLLLFRLALEQNPMFKKVDLPISNFVKGSNIQFYLSMSPL